MKPAQTIAHELNHVINPMMDVAKMRNYTSGYKRHTIKRFIRPFTMSDQSRFLSQQHNKLRQSISDYFFVYCRQVLPKMEEKIERQLLEKFRDRLGNAAEKKEVLQAYLQRKDNLARLAEEKEYGQREKREEQLIIPADEFGKVIMNVEGDGLSYHTYEDIGRYTVFPKQHVDRMFPGEYFGNYLKDEYEYNQTFGIMTREEGLRITNDLARLTLPYERKFDYIQLLGYENTQVKEEIIKDEQKFIGVQQDFSLDLLDYINSFDNTNQEYYLKLKKLFQSPSVFDGLVTILVQELKKKPIRYHLCIKEARVKVIDQIVKQFVNIMIDKNLNPQRFGEIIENLPLIQIDLERKELGEHADLQKNEVHNYKLYASGYHKTCYGLWRPEDVRRVSLERFKGNNSGVLLWGPRGCGKSQILTYVSAWAHENKWMVFNVPRCEAFVDGRQEIFRYKNGLYLQQNLAVKTLKEFGISNSNLLSLTEVNQSIYGKYDISGVRDGDPEPCPKYWDEERKTWSDSWKDNLYDFEIKALQQKYEEMNYRLADKLKEPQTLWQIVEFGIRNPDLATCAVAEVLEQIYRSDKFHTLFALDGFNDWLKPSNYLSFRYETNKHSKGYIPPHDFALVRLLMKFDGHMTRNGFKMLATTHLRQYKHMCTPEMIHFPDGYHAKVDNLALNDFRSMITYYNISEWMPDYFKEHQIESWFMETQGNWWAFQHAFNRANRPYYG